MPYNNPIKKNGSSCTRMYDEKGKQSGLMMEGSAAHMESAMKMSPYKMENTDPEEKKTKPKKETKDAYINRMLDKLQKENSDMNPMEMMRYAKNSYEALPPEKK